VAHLVGAHASAAFLNDEVFKSVRRGILIVDNLRAHHSKLVKV
jgi:hypothetical protein